MGMNEVKETKEWLFNAKLIWIRSVMSLLKRVS
jgi:hypothetical protein